MTDRPVSGVHKCPGVPQPAGAEPVPGLDAVRERRAAAAGGGHGPHAAAFHGHRHRHGERVRPQQLGLGCSVPVRGGETPQTASVQADFRAEGGQEPAGRQGQGLPQQGTHRRGGAAGAEAARPRTREAPHRPEEGEARHAHPRPHHGLVHRLLAAVLLHVHPQTGLPHSGHRLLHGLLAGVHELGAQPGHLHHLQQGLPEGLPADPVQVMFGVRVLLRVRQPTDTHGAVPQRTERPLPTLNSRQSERYVLFDIRVYIVILVRYGWRNRRQLTRGTPDRWRCGGRRAHWPRPCH